MAVHERAGRLRLGDDLRGQRAKIPRVPGGGGAPPGAAPAAGAATAAAPAATGNGGVYDLSTDEFADIIHPQGYKNLISFEMEHGPVWRFQVGDAVIEKSITLVHGQDTVIVRY